MNVQIRLKTHTIAAVVIMLTLVLTASPAFCLFGGKVKAFSADNVSIDPDGKVISTAKIYVSEKVMRFDGLPGAGMSDVPMPDLSMLVFKNQDKMVLYNHDKKLVYEGPAEDNEFGAGSKALDNIESEKVLGKEKVSGYDCVKKEVTVSVGAGGYTFKNKMVVWESDKFEFPLRTQDEDGSISEMRNIKEGEPPKKLMRLMPGYKKVDSMMAAMGMDLGAMMGQQGEQRRSRTRDQRTGGQDMQNMDVNQMMAAMNQAMGDNMDPEQKKQFMQMMGQAMNQAQQTQEGPGAAGQLWQIIPQRPGDTIGPELKTPNVINVTLGSNSALKEVFNFYQTQLSAKGWTDKGMFLQGGEGFLNMTRGEQMVTISSSDDPGIEGSYKYFYTIQLRGPGI